MVENATGSSCEQDIDYYPYGGVVYDYCGTVQQHYRFTGKERDIESNLDYFEARHYGSSLGRFMQPDPLPWLGWQHPAEDSSEEDERRGPQEVRGLDFESSELQHVRLRAQ